jgi:predicted glycosyltransferase
MRILIDMGHPAHVHFFRNAIKELQNRGHEVKITARDKDVTLQLLDAYGMEYEVRGRLHPSLMKKATDMLRVDLKVMEIAKKFNPDLMMGIHNPYIAQVSKMLGVPSVTVTDSEPVPIADFLTFPFTTAIITPTTYRKELGAKHHKVNSFKEIAYLHPYVFTPDPSVLGPLGIKSEDNYVIMRFVSWEASHDVEMGGLTDKDKSVLVDSLKDKYRILISSEGKLPPTLEGMRMKSPPHRFHDLLAFASMLVTDSQTVTTEAACLGVPVVRCNSFVGDDDMGNFIELEQKYGLIFSLRDPKKAIEKAKELAQKSNLKDEWKERKEKMLQDKVEFTKYLVNLVEGWPGSLGKLDIDGG